MIINKTRYCLSSVISNIQSNILINLTALTTITFTFVIFTTFLLLVINLSEFKINWIERLHVLVYLDDKLNNDSINIINNSLKAHPEISHIKFVSKKDALKSLNDSLEGQDGILEYLNNNPLPNSFEINIKPEFLNIESIENLINKMDKIKGITDIEYGQKWLERFNGFFYFLKITGMTIGAFLFISSLFIISNTIKLMVYSRRDEIEIMKLVGSTGRFIKIPFYIEGILHGITGSAAALLIVYVIYEILTLNIALGFNLYFGTNTFLFLNTFQFSSVILCGLFLGLTGTFISLKSLKEFKI
jgi:cell division transport system permease protein